MINTYYWDLAANVSIREGPIGIAAYAFAYSDQLMAITIPDSLMFISECAFYDCNSLDDVYYYATNEQWYGIRIEERNNYSLWNANIHFNCNPNGTPGIIYEIMGNHSYAAVIGYEGERNDIIIGTMYDGVPVTEISKYAFIGKSIDSLIIPDSVTTISQNAFENCYIAPLSNI